MKFIAAGTPTGVGGIVGIANSELAKTAPPKVGTEGFSVGEDPDHFAVKPPLPPSAL